MWSSKHWFLDLLSWQSSPGNKHTHTHTHRRTPLITIALSPQLGKIPFSRPFLSKRDARNLLSQLRFTSISQRDFSQKLSELCRDASIVLHNHAEREFISRSFYRNGVSEKFCARIAPMGRQTKPRERDEKKKRKRGTNQKNHSRRCLSRALTWICRCQSILFLAVLCFLRHLHQANHMHRLFQYGSATFITRLVFRKLSAQMPHSCDIISGMKFVDSFCCNKLNQTFCVSSNCCTQNLYFASFPLLGE